MLLWVLYGVTGLLVLVEILVCVLLGKKRGGRINAARLITWIVGTLVAALVSYFGIKFAVKFFSGKIPDLPANLISVAESVAMAVALPVVAFLLYWVFDFISFLIFLPIKSSISKKNEESCENLTVGAKAGGIVIGLVIAIVTAGVILFPAIKVAGLYKDYEAQKDNIQIVVDIVNGKMPKSDEMIKAVDSITSYVLDTNIISDEEKTAVANYGIGIVNDAIKEMDSPILSNFQLETYDTIEEHKQQISAVVGIAQSVEDTGLLDAALGNGEASLDTKTILDAVKNEDTARNFIQSVEKMPNGGELLTDFVNSTVSELSSGQVPSILSADALKNLAANEEALVKTMTMADTFSNMTMDSYNAMSIEDREKLIARIEEIKRLGVADAATLDYVISQIRVSIEKDSKNTK